MAAVKWGPNWTSDKIHGDKEISWSKITYTAHLCKWCSTACYRVWIVMAKVVGVRQNWDILCKNLIKCILLEAGPDMIFSLLIPKGIGGTENIIGSHKPIQFQSSLGTYTRLLNVNHRYNWLSLLLLWSISHHEHWIRKYWMISPRRNTGLDSYEPLVTFWSNNQYIFNVFLFNLKKWHLTLNIVHSLALSSWPMVL